MPHQHLIWCSQKRKLKLPLLLNIPVYLLFWREQFFLVHLDSISYQLLDHWEFITQDPLLAYTFSLNIVAEVRMKLCWLSSGIEQQWHYTYRSIFPTSGSQQHKAPSHQAVPMDMWSTKSDCVQELFNRTAPCTLPAIGNSGKGTREWKLRTRTKLCSWTQGPNFVTAKLVMQRPAQYKQFPWKCTYYCKCSATGRICVSHIYHMVNCLQHSFPSLCSREALCCRRVMSVQKSEKSVLERWRL